MRNSYWLRQCEGHAESLLLGSGMSTELVSLGKRNAMLMFAMRQEDSKEEMHDQSIVVLVHSQAAVKAHIKCTVTSVTMFNYIRNLNQSGKQNHVSIAWIHGHAGVHGNEVADFVAKSGSKSKIHGPESFKTVPCTSCVSMVKDWSTDRWKSM